MMIHPPNGYYPGCCADASEVVEVVLLDITGSLDNLRADSVSAWGQQGDASHSRAAQHDSQGLLEGGARL